MNEKMIEILKSCGFKQDSKGSWTVDIHNDKYLACAEEDSWGDARVLVYEMYYADSWQIDDSEGIDFTEFILHYFE